MVEQSCEVWLNSIHDSQSFVRLPSRGSGARWCGSARNGNRVTFRSIPHREIDAYQLGMV